MDRTFVEKQARRALDHLDKGNLALGLDWEEAHEICQALEGVQIHDRIHALCHRIEGDFGNAAYWDRRGNQSTPSVSLKDEWAGLVQSI